MIGRINLEAKSAIVIGGGMSGLLAAYSLDRAGFEVQIFEASDRLGGLIQTQSSSWGIAESAAHSLLVTPAVRAFCDETGVQLEELRPESSSKYILRKGKLRKFPLSMIEAAQAFLRAYFVLAQKTISPEQLNLEQWTQRHLGPPALEYLITPMLYGIYGASPSEISVGAAFPSLAIPHGHSLLSYQLHRFIRGKRKNTAGKKTRVMAPRGGMEEIVQGLITHLSSRLGNRIHLNERPKALPKVGNLILAVPAYEASHYLQEVDPTLSQALKEIDYTPLVTATVFIEKSKLKKVPNGIGVLIPEVENRSCLGILFNSSAFPYRVIDENHTVSCTVILGGSKNPQTLSLSDSEITTMIRKEFESLFGLMGDPLGMIIQRWPRAIPKSNLHLMKTWELARQGWCAQPGHLITGNYTGEISIRGMIETMSNWKESNALTHS